MDVYRRAVVAHTGSGTKLACSTSRSVPAAPPSPPAPPQPPPPSLPPAAPPPPPLPLAPGSTVYVVTFPDRGANYPKGTITLSQDDA